MKQGIVSRVTKGMFRYQGWPTVCADENGVLYVGASGHRLSHICPFGKDLMYISRDGGETWSVPRIINDTFLDDRDVGLVPMGNGKLLLSWFSLPREFYWNKRDETLRGVPAYAKAMTAGVMEDWNELSQEDCPAGSFVRLSRDGGETWEDPVQIPVTAPHGPALLRNGKLLYLGTYFGGYQDGGKTIAAYESDDDGKTWTHLANVEVPADLKAAQLCEPHVVELPDGTLLGAIRIQGASSFGSLSIYTCTSADGGKTWTMPIPTGVEGAPPHLMVHSSGVVIMTFGRRVAPFGERARISRDGGKTWSEDIVLNHEGVDGDLGYPSTAELPDGSLITVYYQKVPGDRNCSVLYTKWNLSEI